MRTTADPWDIAAYAVGAVVAILWWRGKDLWNGQRTK